jgi:ABC-type uncharacterized transport system ATPase subunit
MGRRYSLSDAPWVLHDLCAAQDEIVTMIASGQSVTKDKLDGLEKAFKKYEDFFKKMREQNIPTDGLDEGRISQKIKRFMEELNNLKYDDTTSSTNAGQ